jgi:hypothetical protein
VLSASGPSYSRIGDNAFDICDQKFVLFSFEKGELSEKVIYKTTPEAELTDSDDDAYTWPADINLIDFVDFSDGSKAFLLNTSQGGYGTRGHLFMETGGSVKDVLDFDQAVQYKGRYDGVQCFEGVLVPTPKAGLDLIKRIWTYKMGEDGPPPDPGYHYSAIHYRFDLEKEKYEQVGDEEEFPAGKDLGLWPNPILGEPLFFR